MICTEVEHQVLEEHLVVSMMVGQLGKDSVVERACKVVNRKEGG